MKKKEEIIRAAFDLVKANGFGTFGLRELARAAATSHQLVTHHYSSMPRVDVCVVQMAIQDEDLDVIAKVIVSKRSALIQLVPNELRLAAIKSLL